MVVGSSQGGPRRGCLRARSSMCRLQAIGASRRLARSSRSPCTVCPASVEQTGLERTARRRRLVRKGGRRREESHHLHTERRRLHHVHMVSVRLCWWRQQRVRICPAASLSSDWARVEDFAQSASERGQACTDEHRQRTTGQQVGERCSSMPASCEGLGSPQSGQVQLLTVVQAGGWNSREDASEEGERERRARDTPWMQSADAP
jgi:hypothetical protein